ncbi:TRAP transporter permease [Thermodesulfobacteriota bacterium]
MNEKNRQDAKGSLSPAANIVISVLAIALTCSAIIRALDLDRMVGIVIYTEQYLGIMLSIAIPLVYLAVPAGKGRRREGKVPWFDILGAVIGFITSVYTTIRFPVLAELTTARPLDGIIIGAVMLILLVEGLRRTVGIVLPILVVAFFIIALIGHLIPGMLQGSHVSIDKLVYYLAWDSSGVLGIPMRIVTSIVVAFVLFGQVLFQAGGSGFFTDIATALMGRFRGGPAKISVFASSIFGSISGSTVSNVVTTGVITIPLMKKGGYRAHLAGAIEAVASTGGQLMPPVMGAAAFLMAEFLSIPYTEVVLAALIPAILYYVALFLEADLEAARTGISRIDESKIPAAGPVLKAGWFFPLPFIVLIVALFWLNDLPEKAALRAAAVIVIFGVLLGYKGKRLKIPDLVETLKSTGLGVLEIIMIGAAAGMVIGILYLSGLSFGLTLALVQIASGNLLLLLLMAAVVCIILGMGMPTIGVYVLLATMVAPALVESGIEPISAHMFILYFGMMSMITPPVAIGAFAAATLSGADPMRTGYAAMRFGWLAFVIPFMFVASPTLLMIGSPLNISMDLVTALIGTCLISMSIVGYFLRPLGIFIRIIFAAAGLALLVPTTSIEHSGLINMIGLAVAIISVGREFVWRHGVKTGRSLKSGLHS